jgi:hypothetical protein
MMFFPFIPSGGIDQRKLPEIIQKRVDLAMPELPFLTVIREAVQAYRQPGGKRQIGVGKYKVGT